MPVYNTQHFWRAFTAACKAILNNTTIMYDMAIMKEVGAESRLQLDSESPALELEFKLMLGKTPS